MKRFVLNMTRTFLGKHSREIMVKKRENKKATMEINATDITKNKNGMQVTLLQRMETVQT